MGFHKRREDEHHPIVRTSTSPPNHPIYNPGYIRAPTPVGEINIPIVMADNRDKAYEAAMTRPVERLASFEQPDLLALLDQADSAALDALPFGVIGMTLDGTVSSYNTAESRLAGLTPSKVIGRHFFSAVAPCTNNFMVAHRFETEAVMDDIIDYVFTLRMRPMKVRLRLLKRTGCSQMFLAVEQSD